MWNHSVALIVTQPLLLMHCSFLAILHVFARRAFVPLVPRNAYAYPLAL